LAKQIKISDDRRKAFLAELARTGSIAQAARAASPHAKSGAVTSFRDLIRRDREFAAAVEEAMFEARGVIEAEIHRRAVEGVERPVYDKQGKPIGVVREYSDRLLELKARATLPEYNRALSIPSVNVAVQNNTTVGIVPPEDMDALRELPRADQDALHEILRRMEIRARDEDARRASIPDSLPSSGLTA